MSTAPQRIGRLRSLLARPDRVRRLVTYVCLSVVGLVWIYPFLWVVSSSLKPNGDVFAGLGLIPTKPFWSNYADAWSQAHVGRYFLNSLVVSVVGVAIVLVTTSTMGYVLGRIAFTGKRVIIGLLAALVFLPQGYTIIPVFDLINKLHLDNSLFGIALAESGSAHVLQLLLFAGYFRQLPKELEEAAIIDGAGFYRTFLTIFLPLAKPVIATVVIIQFIASWNDFLIPLVLTLSRPDLQTLAVGVYSFKSQYGTNYSGMAAASTISLIPVIVVFLALQRHFVRGIAGAVK